MQLWSLPLSRPLGSNFLKRGWSFMGRDIVFILPGRILLGLVGCHFLVHSLVSFNSRSLHPFLASHLLKAYQADSQSSRSAVGGCLPGRSKLLFNIEALSVFLALYFVKRISGMVV